MGEGRRTVDLAAGRRDPHAAEEGVQRQLDAWREVGDHFVAVERNDFKAAVGILHGQKAAAESEGIAGEVDIDIDLENLHLEHIAGFCLGDCDRPGQNVSARTDVLHFLVDRVGVGRNLIRLDATAHHLLGRTARRECLDSDRIA